MKTKTTYNKIRKAADLLNDALIELIHGGYITNDELIGFVDTAANQAHTAANMLEEVVQ